MCAAAASRIAYKLSFVARDRHANGNRVQGMAFVRGDAIRDGHRTRSQNQVIYKLGNILKPEWGTDRRPHILLPRNRPPTAWAPSLTTVTPKTTPNMNVRNENDMAFRVIAKGIVSGRQRMSHREYTTGGGGL